MVNINTEKYKNYIEDQRSDGLGGGADDKYLDYLTKTLLPGFDYKAAKVLDVGCSRFTTWDYFKEHFSNEIVGIDVGREGLQHCKEHKKYGSIELDAHFLGEYFPPEHFDLVISFHALEHMFDLEAVITHIYNVLKPGGYFYCSVPSPSLHRERGHYQIWYSNSEFLTRLEHCGFNKVLHDELVQDLRFRPEQEGIFLLRK